MKYYIITTSRIPDGSGGCHPSGARILLEKREAASYLYFGGIILDPDQEEAVPVEARKAALEAEKAALEAEKAALEAEKAALEAEKAALATFPSQIPVKTEEQSGGKSRK